MEKPVVMSQDKLLQLASPFGDLMNKMQLEGGEALHEVVTAGLYALGVALAHMRVAIQTEDTVSTSLSPLWIGYVDFINQPVSTISRSIN